MFDLGDGRYAGTIEARLGPTGDLVVVNEVTMGTYLEGLGEMPARWPMEALKAQAVAARTYAWRQARLGTFERRGLGYDICDSTACQVYRGRAVVEEAGGERWAEAVAATENEVLLHDGEPILARYFSTSGGATRDNAEVFGGDYPYLKGIEDPDDAVSPLHRWRVTMPRPHLDAVLSRGESLSRAVPVASMQRLDRPDPEPDQIRVTGRDGTSVEVTAGTFRSFVSDVAAELYPDRYPGPRSDGRSLPTTIPSSRFTITLAEDELVLEGRGWGHGVGMGQYGALGKAQRGLAYDEILSAYYNGLEPVRTDRVPTQIRVGLRRGGGPLELRADVPVRITAGGQELTTRGLGTWRVEPGPAGTLRLVAPPGYGAPLVVSATEPSRTRPTVVEQIRVDTVVNKPTELTLVVERSDGAGILRRPLGIVDPGRHQAIWDLDDPDGQPVPPGRYEITLLAADETGGTAGSPGKLEVKGIEVPPAPPSSLLPPLDRTVSELPETAAGVGVGALVGLAGGFALSRLTRRRR